MILPFLGFFDMVILLSPSGKTRSSADTKSAFSFSASLFARPSETFHPITVIDNNSPS
jgi:hypothetical protein